VNPEIRFLSLLKRPSAFLPVAMSLLALAVIGIRIAVMGTAPETDEGAAAHLWQLLLAGQIPVIAYFVITSPGRGPWVGLPVLALQILAWLAAAAPVVLLRF
jgi:hypothetical protein